MIGGFIIFKFVFEGKAWWNIKYENSLLFQKGYQLVHKFYRLFLQLETDGNYASYRSFAAMNKAIRSYLLAGGTKCWTCPTPEPGRDRMLISG